MNMNRQTLVALAAVAGALSFQPLARAADTKAPAQPAGGDRPGALRERMQETARELNLTDEQKEKLQTIIRGQMEKLRDLRQDTSLSPEEKREKFQAIREEITAEVKKVLTPEQFEKWKAKQGQLAGGAGGPLARLQEAIKDLNLTDAQKEQLKPIYQEQMEKLRELHQDTSLSIPEKLEKLKAMHKEIAPKLKKVMDAEQYAKWEKDVNQWLEQLQAAFPGREAELAAVAAKGLHHEAGFENGAAAVPAQEFDELRQAALFVGAEVVVDVPAQVVFAEVVVVFGAGADDGIERVQTEVARLAEEAPQRGILDAAAQSPDGINEGQPGHLEPGGAEVPDLVLMRGQGKIQRRVADEHGVVRERGIIVAGEGLELAV